MKPVELRRLQSLMGDCGYKESNKREFKRLGMKLMRELRAALGIEADVRYNAGGIAVGGDCVMHGDRVYVLFNADTDLGILYRSCVGRWDYSGGRNNWFPVRNLLEDGGFEKFVERVQYATARREAA